MKCSYSLQQIDLAVNAITGFMKSLRVITFSGELGAGKTTLIRALCRAFGVQEQDISSPTFSIINEYLPAGDVPFKKIYHMDWYRLSGEEEACQAGVEDALTDPEAFCLIEWPRQAAGLLTMPHLNATIIKTEGESSERLLALVETN